MVLAVALLQGRASTLPFETLGNRNLVHAVCKRTKKMASFPVMEGKCVALFTGTAICLPYAPL